jgi:hypothetical protein
MLHRTFSQSSTFLVFATLDHARPVAQARGIPTPGPAPVLTGVPVSGIAYLDRPAPAGYFIFPDLSVRHEGRYRLRFALYEETKDEYYPSPTDPSEPREFCTHRLDVKSQPFTVFSAKKFPGLAESTALSRIVAEQGCRVRIRRDVRMRRRTDRPRRDHDKVMDETAMLRAQRLQTPDQYDVENQIKSQSLQQRYPPQPQYMQRPESVDRQRSHSDASLRSLPDVTPHPPSFNGAFVAQPGGFGHPGGVPPPLLPPSTTVSQHLEFGGTSQHAPPPVPPPPVAQQDPYNQNRYSTGSSGQYSTPSTTTYHGSREGSISQPIPPVISRRNSVEDFHSRRDSESNSYHGAQPYRPSTPTPMLQFNGHISNGYSQQQQFSSNAHPPQPYQTQPQQAPPQLPSSRGSEPTLKLPPIEPNVWRGQSSTPNTPVSHSTLPSVNPYPVSAPTPQPQQRSAPSAPPPSTISIQAPTPDPNQFPAYYPDQKYGDYAAVTADTNPPTPVELPKKRQWSRVFNSAHTEGPLHNKQRPDTSTDLYGGDIVAVDDDDAYDVCSLKMTYRRADGVEIVRDLPRDADD